MSEHILGHIGDKLSLYQLTIGTLILVAIIQHIFRARFNHAKIPRVGKHPMWSGLATAKQDFVKNGATMIDHGYYKYKNTMFQIQTADIDRIVLSPRYLKELISVPEEVLSLREAMSQRHLGVFTMIDVVLTSHLQRDICRVNLTQCLDNLLMPIKEETDFWLAQTISDGLTSTSPTEVSGYQAILRIVAGVTSRVFVGIPKSRDQKWLDTATNYTLDAFQVSSDLRPYRAYLRRFVAPWLSSTKRLNGHVKAAKNCFGDIVTQRLADHGKREKSDDDSLFQWMIDSAEEADRSLDVLVKKMLFLTLAAVHTSTMSTTHAILDLCTYTEYVQPLRQEIHQAIEAHGWTLAAMNELKLLDSFMKESQRINHPGLLSFNRRVMKPLRLSDGTTLAPGSFICIATNSIAHDPENYPDPEEFDAYRFLNKRLSSPDEINRHQFVSTGQDNLAFGHGKSSCPGRFFAGAQIKMVLVRILMKFDVSFPVGQQIRPHNVYSGESISPDRRQVVVFTPRS